MDFFAFHLMPWDQLPDDFDTKYKSASTKVPNSLFEPKHGGELYNRYLDELVLADTLGFDGVCVNERHQSAYGTMPSPNLMASILARQTERVKIAVVGNALPLYSPPTRVAEEFAMIDCISNGRLIAGLDVGGGSEYYNSSINPTFARSQYQEAFDLVLRCWTEDGPFEHYGKHWKLKYVNPWPRPIQQPHPPVWIPGDGSRETINFVAQRQFSYMGAPYFHIDFFRRNVELFRKACEKKGYTAAPSQLSWQLPIYVAETDEQAREEYGKHLFYFAEKLVKGLVSFPPGYTSARSMAGIQRASKNFLSNVKTWEDIDEGMYAVVGSPATVRDKLAEHTKELGIGNLLGLFQLATLPADLTRKNMTLFAQDVMPALRKQQAEDDAKAA